MNDHDDLEILRDAWAGTEPPSYASRTAARTALLERAAAGSVTERPATAKARRRFTLPRMAVRLVAVGALAGAIAAGVTIVQTAGGTGEDGRPKSVVPGLPAGPVASAAELLERAATTAEKRPFTAPRADQWIYIESRQRRPVKPGGVATGGPYKTFVVREWKRADGTKTASVRAGKIEILGTMPTTPPMDFPTLAALPTDPDALLNWIYKQMGGIGDTEESRFSTAYTMLSAILRDNVLPPKVEAALYRAIKKIPGVTLVDKMDAAGRKAIGLGRVAEGWLSTELLLDPETYRYLGERSIAIRDHRIGGVDLKVTVKKGTLQLMAVRTATAIVDKPGQKG